MFRKLLIGTGTVALALGIVAYVYVYKGLVYQHSKAAAIAAKYKNLDSALGKVVPADLIDFDSMAGGTQALAYLAVVLIVAGVLCLVGSIVIGLGKRPAGPLQSPPP